MIEPERPEAAPGEPASGQGYAYRYLYRVQVSASLDDAFDFLADPLSVPVLEPTWRHMRFVPGPVRDLGLGSEREYVFRWAGWPVYLQLRVTAFERPNRLVLEQVLGPWQSYRRTFTLGRIEAGTEIAERAEFCATPGVVNHLIHRLIAARQTRATAACHGAALRRRFGALRD